MPGREYRRGDVHDVPLRERPLGSRTVNPGRERRCAVVTRLRTPIVLSDYGAGRGSLSARSSGVDVAEPPNPWPCRGLCSGPQDSANQRPGIRRQRSTWNGATRHWKPTQRAPGRCRSSDLAPGRGHRGSSPRRPRPAPYESGPRGPLGAQPSETPAQRCSPELPIASLGDRQLASSPGAGAPHGTKVLATVQRQPAARAPSKPSTITAAAVLGGAPCCWSLRPYSPDEARVPHVWRRIVPRGERCAQSYRVGSGGVVGGSRGRGSRHSALAGASWPSSRPPAAGEYRRDQGGGELRQRQP